MALTPSSMIPLKTRAPSFNLYDTVSKQQLSPKDVQASQGLLVMFICNHCPYVVHLQEGLVALGADFLDSDIGIVAISSNDVASYPEDHPDEMAKLAQKAGFTFPYLYDEDQSAAKAYDATCTPDFFLFDKDLLCVYRGQFDDSRPGNNKPVTGKDIREAMNALINNQPVNPEQIPSVGCSIKWKS